MSEAAPDIELLLRAVDEHPESVRDGTDSLVALYLWRRHGGSDTSFAQAVQALLDAGLVEIVLGEDMRLRLTASGFEHCSAQLGVTADSSRSAADDADESAWDAGRGRTDELSLESLQPALDQMFRIFGLPVDRPISAATLATIWSIERKRGGDLRRVLDAMLAAGELSVARGARTRFALTAAGAGRIRAVEQQGRQ